MKLTKRIVSIMLSCLMLFSCLSMFTVTASAKNGGLSLSDGRTALCNQFVFEETGKSVIPDYVYYSPVDGESDTTKYPLVVWIHGNSSGDYPGHQLYNSIIYEWSSTECQSRFEGTGGAYLFLPRCPTSSVGYAWTDICAVPLKNEIDDFIELHKDTIDTSRIYICGYSVGGSITVKMGTLYPNYFAAVLPIVPIIFPTAVELTKLKNTPVWLFTSEIDNKVSYKAISKPAWDVIASSSNCPEVSRFTTMHKIVTVSGDIYEGGYHNGWNSVINDMFTDSYEPLGYNTIVDGNGNEIKLEFPKGVIYWMSSQSLDNRPWLPSESSSILKKIVDFFNKIIDFLKSFFK